MPEPLRAADVSRTQEMLPVLRRRSQEESRNLANGILGAVSFVVAVGLGLLALAAVA